AVSGATPKSFRVVLDQFNSRLKNPDPRCRRPIPRHRCAHPRRADPDSETVGRRQSYFAFESILARQTSDPIEPVKRKRDEIITSTYLIEIERNSHELLRGSERRGCCVCANRKSLI